MNRKFMLRDIPIFIIALILIVTGFYCNDILGQLPEPQLRAIWYQNPEINITGYELKIYQFNDSTNYNFNSNNFTDSLFIVYPDTNYIFNLDSTFVLISVRAKNNYNLYSSQYAISRIYSYNEFFEIPVNVNNASIINQ